MNKHIITTTDLDKGWINYLFHRTDNLFKIESSLLSGKTMATLFFEPSTRTRLSFEQAITKMNGTFTSIVGPKETSSLAKGESLIDMIKTLEKLEFNFVVIRHHEPYFGLSLKNLELITNNKKMSIINAGDGANEHPTQALLDLYTIYKHFPDISNLKILLCGDLQYSRTTKSLTNLLKIYKPNLYHLDEINPCFNVDGSSSITLKDVYDMLPEFDVIYMTRTQIERHEMSFFENRFVYREFIINQNIIDKMKKDAIVMHPLPRNGEISPEVDEDPRCVFFEQVSNGLKLRMSLLDVLS